MEQNGTEKTPVKQKYLVFTKAYLDNKGNISEACDDAGIGRTTFYRWMKKHNFQVLFQEATEKHNDLIFQRILKLALESDKDMLKFWAKTQMRHRGFIEKQEIEHTGSSAIFNLIEKSVEEIKRGKLNNKSQTTGNTPSS